MGITEHIEGDECKFAVGTGRTPVVENKMILKVKFVIVAIESSIDNIVVSSFSGLFDWDKAVVGEKVAWADPGDLL